MPLFDWKAPVIDAIVNRRVARRCRRWNAGGAQVEVRWGDGGASSQLVWRHFRHFRCLAQFPTGGRRAAAAEDPDECRRRAEAESG